MPTVIYVDVLLVLNFVINFLLLRLTAAAAGCPPPALRLALGAAVGAVGALSIFVAFPAQIAWLAFRLMLAAVMTRIALPWAGLRRWAGSVLCLLAVSFLFSGGMIALSLALRPAGMLMSRGVFYLDLSAAALLGDATLCFVLACWFERILRRRAPRELRCEVLVGGESGSCSFAALIDTGNSLVEPFSQKPVIVCERAAVAAALPLLAHAGEEGIPGIRYVFYKTVGSSGMLPAVEPPLLLIRTEGGEWRSAAGAYLAVTDRPLEAGGCRAVMNPDLLNRPVSVNHQKVGETL